MLTTLNRRNFLTRFCILTTGVALSFRSEAARLPTGAADLSAHTDFPGGGGIIEQVDSVRKVIRFQPHNERDGGWGQVWWYFRVDGLTPGQTLTLELNRGQPLSEGVNTQAYWSADQRVWQQTEPGQAITDGSNRLFVYRQPVERSSLWFAYNIPYLPDQIETLRQDARLLGADARFFELCRSRKNRSVPALELISKKPGTQDRYGIWLQARAHAFESGTSWVLHELARWLLSRDPEAQKLRSIADITVVPVVDVDGVVEGRNGKNQHPHDHNRDWQQTPAHWEEVRAIQTGLSALIRQNKLDLFIDIHGPGQGSHAYFIAPLPRVLPNDRQRANQTAFFDSLNASELTKEVQKTQSMDQFYYSLREINPQTAAGWVTRTAPSVVSMTLEVNMSAPLSTQEGYRLEGQALGRRIARYFTENRPIR